MEKILISLMFFIQLHAVQLSPRLLIAFDPSTSLSPHDIMQQLEAHVVSATNDKSFKKQIDMLDQQSDNHRIILDGPVGDLSDIAHAVGYDFIVIKEQDAASACAAIAAKEQEIPTTDACLPRVNPHDAGLLYHLMMEVDQLLEQHKLPYWATCGTLLGAVRHAGLIPWDDDLDICMYQHDVERLLLLTDALKSRGLAMVQHWIGMYKIFFINGRAIEGKECNWTFPALDIFPVFLTNKNSIHYVSETALSYWPNEYFFPHEVEDPRPRVPFGPMNIPVPHHAHTIVSRMYGRDWNKIAYRFFDHAHDSHVRKIKVALVDRSSVPYILPTH